MQTTVSIIEEYTGNILYTMSSSEFKHVSGLQVRDELDNMEFTLHQTTYKIIRKSTGISALPTYELYVLEV